MRSSMPWRRLSAALLLLLTCSLAGDEHQPVTEYQLKAVFLLNFAKFVEWPEAARAGPIQFCITGRDPFGNLLDDALRGQRVQGRALSIVRTKSPVEMRQCEVLFVSASESKRHAEIILAVRGAAVLTVGETPGFAEAGGMFNLVLESSKVKLESNPDAATQAGLKISSRLLQLTRVVRTVAAGN